MVLLGSTRSKQKFRHYFKQLILTAPSLKANEKKEVKWNRNCRKKEKIKLISIAAIALLQLRISISAVVVSAQSPGTNALNLQTNQTNILSNAGSGAVSATQGNNVIVSQGGDVNMNTGGGGGGGGSGSGSGSSGGGGSQMYYCYIAYGKSPTVGQSPTLENVCVSSVCYLSKFFLLQKLI